MSDTRDYVFCVHSIYETEGNEYEDEPEYPEYIGLNIITFCPAAYWQKRGHLPDFSYSDGLDPFLPQGYKWYVGMEAAQWCSKKPKEEIVKELSAKGFVESNAMEKFLTSCWT